jgi:hypothetical protein
MGGKGTKTNILFIFFGNMYQSLKNTETQLGASGSCL